MKKSELRQLIKEEIKNINIKESKNNENVEQCLLKGVQELNNIVNDYDILTSHLQEYDPKINNEFEPEFEGFKIEGIISKELDIEKNWDGDNLICLTLQLKYSTNNIKSKYGDVVFVIDVNNPNEPYLKESSI